MGEKFSIRESVIIDRPVEAVFKYVADFRNDVNWRVNVVEMVIDGPDPYAVGLKTEEVLRSYGRRMVNVLETTGVEPDRSITFKSISGPVPVVGNKKFESVDGKTKFTFQLSGELGFLYSLLWRFQQNAFRQRIKESLQRLKELLEAEGA